VGNSSGNLAVGERDRMIRVRTGKTLLKHFSIILSLSLALLSNVSSADIRLKQANGDILELPGSAERIITLAPNLAELVFAAGAGDKLQAVVEYSNFPAPVKQLPRVGDAFRIDLERIVEFQPDLIIAWASGNPQTALQKLEQLGMPVWQIEITRPDEIAETLESISRAAGNETHGVLAARALRIKLNQLRADNADKRPLQIFFQIAARPLYTINGEHIISRSLEICGAKNIFANLSSLAPQVSRESVILEDPEVMIATRIEGQPPSLDHWQDWPHLQAVENKAMLYLPADEISQATPRLLDSIELACKLLDEVRKNTQNVN
jgi:iron complex transport system substrate-binding protein